MDGYGYNDDYFEGAPAPGLQAKVPPQNLEAERSLLGLILTQEQARLDSGGLEKDDFYDMRNGLIYDAVRSMMGEGMPVDILSVADYLEGEGLLSTVGGVTYMTGLVDQTAYLNNTREYVAMIREKSLLRRILAFADELHDECYKGQREGDELLRRMAERAISLKGDQGKNSLTPISEILKKTLHELSKADSDKLALESGFPSLDRMLGKLRRQTLNIIAARPAMGKSAFALNIAQHVAESNHTVAVFSLEMSESEVGLRFLSSSSFVNSRKIKDQLLSADGTKPILDALELLTPMPLYVCDSAATTPAEIRAKCRRLTAEVGGLDLVVIDYLQLMGSDGKNQNRQQEISEISRSLKILAKDLNVPIIALSQLSRNVEMRESKRPMLSDLRESGAIEQDADAVMFLYRPAYYDKEQGPAQSPEEAELIIAKNRAGETGTVKLNWFPHVTTFREKEMTADREPPPENAPFYHPEPEIDLPLL